MTSAVLFLLSAMRLMNQVEELLDVPNALEWHLFVTQLDIETKGYHLSKDRQAIVFESFQKDKLPIVLKHSYQQKAGQVVYLSKNNGYHPILIGYKEMSIIHQGKDISIEGLLTKGEAFQINFLPARESLSMISREVIKESTLEKERKLKDKEDTEKGDESSAENENENKNETESHSTPQEE